MHSSFNPSGFIPGGEALSRIADLAASLKKDKPQLIYVLDREQCCLNLVAFKYHHSLFSAVLGDSGRLYVKPDAVRVYRLMLPLATVITPNWYEVE